MIMQLFQFIEMMITLITFQLLKQPWIPRVISHDNVLQFYFN